MSKNNNIEDIFDLTPEMLDQVAGGVMTPSGKKVLDALIKSLKNDPNGEHTPEETIEFVTSRLMDNKNMEGVTNKDVSDYVYANW